MAEENPNLNQTNPSEQRPVNFQVMPQNSGKPRNVLNTPPPPPQASANLPMVETKKSNMLVYVVISIVVLLILGGLGYYFLGGFGTKETTPPPPASSLNSTFLQQYFGGATCPDPSTCGDNADPERDGLNNYQEQTLGTNPLNPDSDIDGLADGDEVNVYGTDPMLKFTDTRDIAPVNNYTDGSQIFNGYDPNTPGVKFTPEKLADIQTKISTNKLHSPTTTTLHLNTDGTPVTETE